MSTARDESQELLAQIADLLDSLGQVRHILTSFSITEGDLVRPLREDVRLDRPGDRLRWFRCDPDDVMLVISAPWSQVGETIVLHPEVGPASVDLWDLKLCRRHEEVGRIRPKIMAGGVVFHLLLTITGIGAVDLVHRWYLVSTEAERKAARHNWSMANLRRLWRLREILFRGDDRDPA